MRIGQKQELFSRLLPSLLTEAHRQGFKVRLGEILRFEQQARWNATHCRKCKQTKSLIRHAEGTFEFDHKFRPIGILNSLHRLKLAIDIILFKDGEPCWNSSTYDKLHDYWESLHPLCAKRIKHDGGHFSITHGGKR